MGAMLATLTALLALQGANSLTAEETKAGWKLLFDGKSTQGWHNFKAEGVRPGWQVKDGLLICAEPENAGDIVTKEKFDWFELKFDFNLSKGGNSGVMFHVADDGDATWHSGPEVQLYDHPLDGQNQITGWLYEIYPGTKDAAKPAGEWNTMRILVSPKKCETYVNGVKYYEYVLGSEDFKSRVAKSKFAGLPNFAKARTGSIALQGDHGVVSFRNMKIRPLRGGR
jgi:hypothetical protein